MDVRDIRPSTGTVESPFSPPDGASSPADGLSLALPIAFLMAATGASVAWWCGRAPNRRILPAVEPANSP